MDSFVGAYRRVGGFRPDVIVIDDQWTDDVVDASRMFVDFPYFCKVVMAKDGPSRRPIGLMESTTSASQTTEIVDRWPSKMTGVPRNEYVCLRRGSDFRFRCHLAAGHEGECSP
jgi:hypothetical protein